MPLEESPFEDSLLESGLPSSPAVQKPLTARGKKRNFRMIFAGFVLVFSGLTTSNRFAYNYTGDFGNPSRIAFYTTAIIAGLVVPTYMLKHFGARVTLACTGAIVALYQISLAYYIGPLAFFGASMSGVADVVIWAVLPTEVNRVVTERNRGTFNALIWAGFKLSELPADLIGITGYNPINYTLSPDSQRADADSDMDVRGWTEPDSLVFVIIMLLAIAGGCCFMEMRSINAREYFVGGGKKLKKKKGARRTPGEGGEGAFGEEGEGGGHDEHDESSDSSDTDSDSEASGIFLTSSCLRFLCDAPHLWSLVLLMFFAGYNSANIRGFLGPGVGVVPNEVAPNLQLTMTFVEVRAHTTARTHATAHATAHAHTTARAPTATPSAPTTAVRAPTPHQPVARARGCSQRWDPPAAAAREPSRTSTL
jgi:hypothetical protein